MVFDASCRFGTEGYGMGTGRHGLVVIYKEY